MENGRNGKKHQKLSVEYRTFISKAFQGNKTDEQIIDGLMQGFEFEGYGRKVFVNPIEASDAIMLLERCKIVFGIKHVERLKSGFYKSEVDNILINSTTTAERRKERENADKILR
jgi:hypothetical protein